VIAPSLLRVGLHLGDGGLRGKASAPEGETLLVEKARQGDKEAFGQLVLQYQTKVFNIALGIVRRPQEAEEVAQEAFVRAYRGIRSFRGHSSFYTWLFRITVNAAKNRVRKLSQEQSIVTGRVSAVGQVGEEKNLQEVADCSLAPDKILAEKELGERIQEEIGNLDEEQRTLIVLRDIQGLDYRDMARILRCSEGTVKSRLHRARVALREKLADVI